MEETENQILAIIDKTGGKALFQTVRDELPRESLRHLPRAIKSLKSKGIAMNQNRFDANGNRVFEVFRLPSRIGDS